MDRRLKAALLSALVLPGAGQLYNKQKLKGLVVVAGTAGAVIALFGIVWRALWQLAVEGDAPLQPFDIPGAFAMARTILDAHGRALFWVHVWLAALWSYATVDAWIVAARTQGNPPGAEPS